MTQQEKFLLEQNFDAYSKTVLRITTQNAMNYHNSEDVVQWVIRFTINFCCNLNRFTVMAKSSPAYLPASCYSLYEGCPRGNAARSTFFTTKEC